MDLDRLASWLGQLGMSRLDAIGKAERGAKSAL